MLGRQLSPAVQMPSVYVLQEASCVVGYMCLGNNLVMAWFSECPGVFQTRELRTASHDGIIPRFDVNLFECADFTEFNTRLPETLLSCLILSDALVRR